MSAVLLVLLGILGAAVFVGLCLFAIAGDTDRAGVPPTGIDRPADTDAQAHTKDGTGLL